MVRWTDHPEMPIPVDWDVKHQTKPKIIQRIIASKVSKGLLDEKKCKQMQINLMFLNSKGSYLTK